jgi:hypothetical protein
MTLEVSPELEQRLKLHSLRQGKSEHQLLEEILQQALPEIAPKKRDWIGMGRSGRGDLSERIDELLFADTERP